jgi:hypothetical protein
MTAELEQAFMDATRTEGLYRTPDHRYFWAGVEVGPSVTKVVGIMDKSGPLVGWAKRITAEAAISHRSEMDGWVEMAGVDGAVSLLTKAATVKRDSAADMGTRVHALADSLARGLETVVTPEEKPFVDGYLAFLTERHPTFRYSEDMVCSLRYGYAGTFDAICDIDGETWLIDNKTSKGIYPETALQLAAYANADFIGRPGLAKQGRIPRIDRYGVLWLRPEGYRLVEYAVTKETFRAFINALDLLRWREGEGLTVMGEKK